jgi:hypothetical protein
MDDLASSARDTRHLEDGDARRDGAVLRQRDEDAPERRDDRPERLRQDDVPERLRERQADGSRRLGLTHRDGVDPRPDGLGDERAVIHGEHDHA